MLPRDRRAWEQNPIGVSNREFDRAMHASRHEWSRRGKWPNLVHACNCCIASVQGIEANPGLHVRQGLVPSGILVEACLGTVLAVPAHHSAGRELSINADTVEGITRLAVALSLLTSYKIGRGGSWRRARQRVARILANGPQKQRDLGGRSSSPTPGPVPGSKRQTFRLHVIVAGLWLALSLLLVAYATIRGEVAFAELDGLDLVTTYSLGPVAPLLDPGP